MRGDAGWWDATRTQARLKSGLNWILERVSGPTEVGPTPIAMSRDSRRFGEASGVEPAMPPNFSKGSKPMNRMSRGPGACLPLAFGIALLAGCHHLERTPANGGHSSLGGEPAKAVTRSQEADMQISLGRAAEHRGAFDEAMVAYKDALRRDKHRADAYQRLAVLYDRRGDFRESAEMYKSALAADPGNPEIYCDMGYSFYLQRRWAEAERNLRQSVAIRPDNARAHNNLGLVLSHDRRSEEAVAEYRRAGNSEAQARSNLALAMTLDGRLDEAKAQYQIALKAEPTSAEARDRLRELDGVIARVTPPASPERDERLAQVSHVAPVAASPPSKTPPKGAAGDGRRTTVPASPPPSACVGVGRVPAPVAKKKDASSPPRPATGQAQATPTPLG
jgi:Tfp pilus assembly protein PilF